MNSLIKFALYALFFINMADHAVTQTPLKDLSLHVLDSAFGGNAPNVTCRLYRKVENCNPNNEKFNFITEGVTDSDGRIRTFLSVEDYIFGIYRIWFGIGDYYLYSHGVSTFFPEVQITYENNDGTASHIPLVVSPYAFSTYKGS